MKLVGLLDVESDISSLWVLLAWFEGHIIVSKRNDFNPLSPKHVKFAEIIMADGTYVGVKKSVIRIVVDGGISTRKICYWILRVGSLHSIE